MLWDKDPDTTPGRHAYVLAVVRFRSIAAAPIQVTQNPMPKAATPDAEGCNFPTESVHRTVPRNALYSAQIG